MLKILHNISKLRIACLFVLVQSISYAQDMPKVFLIGENEAEYEELVTECNTMLLSVCKDSMNVAYSNWLTMLSDMEEYAKTVDYDIKGVKIWINVFWNGDGTLKHIVYYPKSTSRNMDFEELSAFFSSFINNYQLPVKHYSCYSHYGSATFPTFSRRYKEQEK